jgi:hypothetical protein
MKSLEGVPDNEINMITHENAMRLFKFDPFAVRPREECTVGALRAQAADVDLGMKRTGKVSDGKGVTITSLAARVPNRS